MPADFSHFWLILVVYLQKNTLGASIGRKITNKIEPTGGGTSECGGSADPSRLRFFLRLSCTKKDGEYNDQKITWNGNREGAHRKSFRVLAMAALPSFVCDFRLTHRSSCSNLATGVLGIKFQAGMKNFYLFWWSAVASARRQSAIGIFL